MATKIPRVGWESGKKWPDASDSPYFWGVDVGVEKSYGVIAHCHRDEGGDILIDKIEYFPDTQDQISDSANQGLNVGGVLT